MRGRRVASAMGVAALAALGVLAAVPLLYVIVDIYVKGLPVVLSGGLKFLFGLPPTPLGDSGGIGPFLVGTLYMTALGALLGFAMGFPIGVYAGFYARERLASASRAFTNVLVEFPTIAVGLFVYMLFSYSVSDLNKLLAPLAAAPWPLSQFVGQLQVFNAYSGAFALALVMTPYVAAYTASAYASIERELKEAAFSVGGSEANAVLIVLRKAVSRAVLAAALIGTAKIAGETAPLLFTAFGNTFYAPFTGPTGAVSLWIYAAAQQPFQNVRDSAYGAAAVLLTIVLALFILARTRR
ncbi:MAG: ABC transporter permease subunit [Thermoproteus sp.]